VDKNIYEFQHVECQVLIVSYIKVRVIRCMIVTKNTKSN